MLLPATVEITARRRGVASCPAREAQLASAGLGLRRLRFTHMRLRLAITPSLHRLFEYCLTTLSPLLLPARAVSDVFAVSIQIQATCSTAMVRDALYSRSLIRQLTVASRRVRVGACSCAM